jgi:acyl-CoA synthetase (AMP-forming)/AMP-acid ligase II
MNRDDTATDRGFPPSTFVELLRKRADETGDNRLFTFVSEETGTEEMSYGQLDQRARAIGASLRERTRRGSTHLLLYPPGLEFIKGFFGCLYAGCVPVPAYPPDPARLARTLPRLRSIAADAGAVAVLTSKAVAAAKALIFEHAPDLAALDWIATDALPDEAAEAWTPPGGDASSPALIQYTSGSTGTPRGVVVTHENLLHNSALIAECFGHTRRSDGVTWLPCYHDMGLVGGVLQPIFADFAGIMMSPIDFLKRPLSWLEQISGRKRLTSGGPNFAYDLCIRRTTPEQREQLDLSGWSVAFTGAEPVRAHTMERFAEAFAPSGFRHEAFLPCYGLAEATLIVTGIRSDAEAPLYRAHRGELERGRAEPAPPEDLESETLVSCGEPVGETSVNIVEPETRRECLAGRVGEIWISSPSVTAGYWNRPQDTEASFGARLANGDERRFLRTGDLGFMLDGHLFVRGRSKDAIIINGRNLAPQDIERDVEEAHPSLRRGCCAAFSIEARGAERLVVVQETRPDAGAESAEILDAVVSTVSVLHQVSVYAAVLVEARTIPKTSSGKIRRNACREAYLAGQLSVVAASGPVPPPTEGNRPPLAA